MSDELSPPLSHLTFFFEQIEDRIFGQNVFVAEKSEKLALVERRRNLVDERTGGLVTDF